MTIEPTHRAFAFDNSYARLPPRFFARLAPTPVKAPTLIKLNLAVAEQLGRKVRRLRAAIVNAGSAVVPAL